MSPDVRAPTGDIPAEARMPPAMNDLVATDGAAVAQGTNVRTMRRSLRSLLLGARRLSAPPRLGPRPFAVPFRYIRGSPQFRSVSSRCRSFTSTTMLGSRTQNRSWSRTQTLCQRWKISSITVDYSEIRCCSLAERKLETQQCRFCSSGRISASGWPNSQARFARGLPCFFHSGGASVRRSSRTASLGTPSPHTFLAMIHSS